jgi:hypothetical protein
MNQTLAWITNRLDQLLMTPRMWGSREAVEMQVLTLIEVRLVICGKNPLDLDGKGTRLLDVYQRFLYRRFPNRTGALYQILEDAAESYFVEVLQDFRFEEPDLTAALER